MSRIIFAVNDQQRFFDLLYIIDRRGLLHKRADFRVTLITIFGAHNVAAPAFRVRDERRQVRQSVLGDYAANASAVMGGGCKREKPTVALALQHHSLRI